MLLHNIIIGGVEISLDAAHQISQTYETIGGRSQRRMLDGSALLQNNWVRRRTVITGQGRLPEGLSGLDYDTTQVIACMAPLSIWSATTNATLPAARRTDWPPHGYAIVSGRQISTPISIAGNAVTFSAVSGASGYVVVYYPSLTCYLSPPRLSFDGRGPVAGWTLEAEEI